MNTLQEKLELSCWIAKTFFNRGMGSGTSGNFSFLHEGHLYITGSNTCFGMLKPEQFAKLDLSGNICNAVKPSKEWPLHLAAYENNPQTGAVIHIHSTYATLWSCLPHAEEADCVPDYTPYLKMKLGTVGLIPYAKPGSEALLQAFRNRMAFSDGWLLANHGLVTPGKTIMDAFSACEELEAACRIAWELRGVDTRKI